ncbi:hypothetical protein E4T56_gene6338 [Termitomyces sp. T112]|nr:hypothetical protein E4T56_gene6338 [Termitomyces sp. T112]
MAGAFRTTPTNALEIDMAIPPITITLDVILEGYANRMHKLKTTNPIVERLTEEWRKGNKATYPPPLPSRRKTRNKKKVKPTQLEKITGLTYSPMEGESIDPFISPPWRKTAGDYGNRLTITGVPKECKKVEEAKKHNEKLKEMERDEDRIVVYSDGSMREEDDDWESKIVGWGMVGYHQGREIFSSRGGLGHHAEVYDAELVVTSAYGPKPAPGQTQMLSVTHHIDRFLDGQGDRTVNIGWCPGHQEVKGNKRADGEAKRGAGKWSTDYTTMTNAKRRTKEKALKTWREDWKKKTPTGGFAIANRLEPRWRLREHVIHTPREVFGRLTQCHTKHAFLGEYFARFVPHEKTGCICGERYQTREHVIKTCPQYEGHRYILRKADEHLELGRLLGTKEGLEAMTKFLEKTGAFTKTGTKRKQKETPTEEDDENNEEEGRWWQRMERMRDEADGLMEREGEEAGRGGGEERDDGRWEGDREDEDATTQGTDRRGEENTHHGRL